MQVYVSRAEVSFCVLRPFARRRYRRQYMAAMMNVGARDSAFRSAPARRCAKSSQHRTVLQWHAVTTAAQEGIYEYETSPIQHDEEKKMHQRFRRGSSNQRDVPALYATGITNEGIELQKARQRPRRTTCRSGKHKTALASCARANRCRAETRAIC